MVEIVAARFDAAAQMTGEANERRESRRTVIGLELEDWLGSVGDHGGNFNYRLLDVSPTGARIAVPREAPGAGALMHGASVHLHLPFRHGSEYHDVGVVARCIDTDDFVERGVRFAARTPLKYPVYLLLANNLQGADIVVDEADRNAVFARVVKDAYFLKRGILIYLDHLIPLFTRAAIVRKRLRQDEAREHFAETRAAIAGSIDVLEEFQKLSSSPGFDFHQAGAEWDWARLRRAVSIDFLVEEFAGRYRTREVRPYLHSIRLLDHRLYTNFNTLLALRFLAAGDGV